MGKYDVTRLQLVIRFTSFQEVYSKIHPANISAFVDTFFHLPGCVVIDDENCEYNTIFQMLLSRLAHKYWKPDRQQWEISNSELMATLYENLLNAQTSDYESGSPTTPTPMFHFPVLLLAPGMPPLYQIVRHGYHRNIETNARSFPLPRIKQIIHDIGYLQEYCKNTLQIDPGPGDSRIQIAWIQTTTDHYPVLEK